MREGGRDGRGRGEKKKQITGSVVKTMDTNTPESGL